MADTENNAQMKDSPNIAKKRHLDEKDNGKEDEESIKPENNQNQPAPSSPKEEKETSSTPPPSIQVQSDSTEDEQPPPKKNPRLQIDIEENEAAKSEEIKPSANKPMAKKGGLASLVGTLKGPKKQSMLEKSAQDWRQFVEQEDIGEELTGHLRSRDAYLDKQEFLRRADYSQFEKERDLRAHERKTQQQQQKKGD